MPRPKSFSEFYGQPKAVGLLQTAVTASRRRQCLLGHALFVGPPGVGKTTLAAHVLPTELGLDPEAVKLINCTAVDKPADILPTLTTVPPGGVLFLDEIHALKADVCEYLYHVMEDQQVTVTIGEGDDVQFVNVELPEYMIFGATTREGLIPEPMRDRFRHIVRLEMYQDQGMRQVLRWTADELASDKFEIWDEALDRLVRPCHGTARYAGRLLESAVDEMYVRTPENSPLVLTAELAELALQRLGYNSQGLQDTETRLLQQLSIGRPIGVSALAAALDEEPRTIEDVYEPWLLQQGLIMRTPQGRQITEAGKQVLNAIT